MLIREGVRDAGTLEIGGFGRVCFIFIVDVKVPIQTHLLFSRAILGVGVLVKERVGDTVTSKVSCVFFKSCIVLKVAFLRAPVLFLVLA